MNDPECDPLCTRQETIPLDDGMGNFLQCKNDTCVIDDVSIEASRSTVGGTINFDQICNNCNPCTCIISGINISETAGQVNQLKAEFNQFCGQDSICLKIEPNGVDQTINCQDALTGGSTPATTTIPWWLIIGAVLVIVVVALILIYLRRDR
jgi:hypothetical protein